MIDLVFEEPLAPGAWRDYVVKEHGDHPTLYQLIDAHCGCTLMADVNFHILLEYLLARKEADGQEPRIAHEGKLVPLNHWCYTKAPQE
jgi:hypothetical protein